MEKGSRPRVRVGDAREARFGVLEHSGRGLEFGEFASFFGLWEVVVCRVSFTSSIRVEREAFEAMSFRAWHRRVRK